MAFTDSWSSVRSFLSLALSIATTSPRDTEPSSAIICMTASRSEPFQYLPDA